MSGRTYELTIRRDVGQVAVSLNRHKRMSERLAADINAALAHEAVSLVRNPSGAGWVLSDGSSTSDVDLNETSFGSLTLTIRA